MAPFSRFLVASLCLLTWASISAQADDWPLYGRDATRKPVSPEKDPPLWWQVERPAKNVLWQIDLAGHTRASGGRLAR